MAYSESSGGICEHSSSFVTPDSETRMLPTVSVAALSVVSMQNSSFFEIIRERISAHYLVLQDGDEVALRSRQPPRFSTFEMKIYSLPLFMNCSSRPERERERNTSPEPGGNQCFLSSSLSFFPIGLGSGRNVSYTERKLMQDTKIAPCRCEENDSARSTRWEPGAYHTF